VRDAKRRPVLIITDTGDADLLVVPITSHKSRSAHDVELSDWQAAGLRLPSTARMTKLATVAKITVIRNLGRLSERDLRETRKTLGRFFRQVEKSVD
jgi:mRNA-degrading endonuclease toxin of MazEF toxin-antitoxin module